METARMTNTDEPDSRNTVSEIRTGGFKQMGGHIRVMDEMTAEEREEYLKGLIPRDQDHDAEVAAADAAARRVRISDLRKLYRENSGLRGKTLSRTFDSFHVRSQAQGTALHVARKFIEHYPNTRSGLMIYGPSGSGKSHLAQSILNAALALETPAKVLYIDCFELGAIVRRDSEFVPSVADYRLVVLDDIEKALDGDCPQWSRDAVKTILEMTANTGSPLLVATSQTQLRHVPDPNNPKKPLADGHDRHQPEYVISRLDELFHWEPIDGPDGRHLNAEEQRSWWAE
jgi:DNA replication protein DnaC